MKEGPAVTAAPVLAPIDLAKALRWQWKNSSRKNLRLCGCIPIGNFVNVYSIDGGVSDRKIVMSGLRRCHSASACVVCSASIGRHRGEVLSRIFAKAHEQGKEISMITLTIRHKRGDSLNELREAMVKSMNRLQTSVGFIYLRKKFNAEFVRVIEVTYGSNGFHPHFHIAVIHDKGVDWTKTEKSIAKVWLNSLNELGFESTAERAVNVVSSSTAEQQAWYLTKASGVSSAEISAGRVKEGRNGNQGIWQIHGRAVDGDRQAKAIWLEYEAAVKGWHIFIPSRGLADKYGESWEQNLESEALNLERGSGADDSGELDADNIHYVK